MDNQSVYRDKIEKSLLKKALGYRYKEIIEEYTIDENGERLSKKKITTKDVPPDISAVKVLLDSLMVAQNVDFSTLTDEELKQEIKKAMDLIEGGDSCGNKED